MSRPVTVLLATYNGEQYLKEQLDSIFAQTYDNWRLLASDDGSSDMTPSILEAYRRRCPERITVLKNDARFGGARGNFFHLMRNCEGYAMPCDQDDVWKPDKIELTMEAMARLESGFGEDKPLLVFTDLEVTDEDLNAIAPSFLRYSKLDGRRTSLNHLLVQNVVTGCTVMMNEPLRRLALKVTDENGILMHDWWLALAAAAAGQIAFVNSPTVKYRQHGKNAVGAKDAHSLSYILDRLKGGDIKKSLRDAARQAGQLAETLDGDMPAEKLALAQWFALLYSRRKLARITFMIKNRIMKKGAARKAAQLIWG